MLQFRAESIAVALSAAYVSNLLKRPAEATRSLLTTGTKLTAVVATAAVTAVVTYIETLVRYN